MYDPTTGLFLVTSDFYRVLGVVVAARYTRAEAMERWAATGSAKEWPETLAASAQLIEQWGGRLERQCPELADWIAEMLERDARFSMEYDRLARRGRLLLLHVWATALGVLADEMRGGRHATRARSIGCAATIGAVSRPVARVVEGPVTVGVQHRRAVRVGDQRCGCGGRRLDGRR